MRLTDFTDYTLRALMYLALRDDKLSTIEEIAGAYDVSKHHMAKIIQHLTQLGWVDSVRGRRGGMRLAPRTRELTVGAIVRASEHDFTLAACHAMDAGKDCAIVQHCRLQHILAHAREAFLAELDSCTLADLATPAQPLAMVLGLIRPGRPVSLNHK
ncbi:HTH-type transcriptional repressor NsrR [Paraburkholderia nemoris]|nr:Rrf2 family transcriptional regulator [Paraburkholderia aspalathi]CAE6815732.1 HTH-type transcriptional repressor NsrR [Paraburkholderia nemoris]